jgi:tetratricopeptide (TPR) repeat protein
LEDRKKLLHARVTKVLQEDFPELIKSKPELLAYHLTKADLYKEAVLKWEEAGALAAQHFSTKEAVHHLRQGLSLLDRISDEAFSIEKETNLLAMLTPIMQLSYGNKDAESMGLRWLKAAEASGKIDKIHDAYVGQFTFNMFSTKYFESEPYGKKIIELGAQRKDPFMQATSFFFYGILQSLLGNHINSANYYERAKALYDPALHLNKSYYHTGNILANILTYGSTTFHLLGKIDQALEDVEDARKLVYTVKQPSSIYANAAFYSRLYLIRKEYDKVESVALPALNLAKENGDTFLVALLTYYLNTAYALIGDQTALQIAHGIMNKLYEKYKAFHIAFMVFIAEAYLKFENYEVCSSVITHAENHMQKTQEGLFSPMLIKIKGDLILQQNLDKESAYKTYISALQLAKSQSDQWHELLIAKSLVELNYSEGDKSKKMLQDVYNRFESGFDTKDLKEVKDLLN